MTGFRVGFTRANAEYIEVAGKLQEAVVSCGTSFAQIGAMEALNGPQDRVEIMRAAYHRRRDAAIRILDERGRYEYTPEGAFYLLVNISDSKRDSRQFALDLLQNKHVAVAPGSTFGSLTRDHIRISIASPEASLQEGLHRLCDYLDELKRMQQP